MLLVAFTTMVGRSLPTGPLAGFLWLAFALVGICYGLFGKEYRKGRLVKARRGEFYAVGLVGASGGPP